MAGTGATLGARMKRVGLVTTKQRQTDRQTDRQACRQTDRVTDMQADKWWQEEWMGVTYGDKNETCWFGDYKTETERQTNYRETQETGRKGSTVIADKNELYWYGENKETSALRKMISLKNQHRHSRQK